eukprot:5777887-Pleurochrysis_carterae.AAC.1
MRYIYCIFRGMYVDEAGDTVVVRRGNHGAPLQWHRHAVRRTRAPGGSAAHTARADPPSVQQQFKEHHTGAISSAAMESMPSTTEFAVGAAACFVAVVLLHLVLHQRISAALSSTQKAAEQMIKVRPLFSARSEFCPGLDLLVAAPLLILFGLCPQDLTAGFERSAPNRTSGVSYYFLDTPSRGISCLRTTLVPRRERTASARRVSWSSQTQPVQGS